MLDGQFGRHGRVANRDATDEMYHWIYQDDVNLGEISQIYVGPSQDETI